VPEFVDYCYGLGRALNDLGSYPVASATTTAITLAPLADSTTSASADRYDGAYIYFATGAAAGNQRRVKPGGFSPSTGTLTLALLTTPPTLGDIAEITRLFPIVEQVPSEDASYRTLINDALATLWAPDRVSFSFSNSATASIAALPWLDRPDRLVRVLETAPRSGFPDVSCEWRDPRLILDGPAPVLQLNRPFTGTLTLEVRRPGNTLISGVESTVGFEAEGQTALPSVEDVIVAGLVEAYAVLMNRSPGRPGGSTYEKKYADAREQLESLVYYDRSRVVAQRAPQPVQGAA
jgi:hypothetical protein